MTVSISPHTKSTTMNHSYLLLLSLICALTVSCKKRGCTDCNAINFVPSANTNDNSCLYNNEEHLGWYQVVDSILEPPSMEWEKDTFNLRITRANCEPNHLTISNYGNLNNRFLGYTFQVECFVSDSSITVLAQNVDTKQVRSTSGVFRADSIFFDVEYSNEFGEVFLGKTFGVKK